MMIYNPDKIKYKIICNFVAAKYLQYKGFNYFAKIDNCYYFVDIGMIKETLENMPPYLKTIARWTNE